MASNPEPDPPAQAAVVPDRREEFRQMTVRLVAKLRTSEREELCLVRNLSSRGLTAHVYSAIEVDSAVTFEFASGVTIPARVVWQRDSVMGVQFAERTDPALILSVRERFPDAPAPRAPRVELNIGATARVNMVHRPITLNNISQGGARVAVEEPVDVREKLTLLIDGLPPLTGQVRWSRGGVAGLAFLSPVPFDILAQWLPMVQRPPESG
ncbi:hypothetical protein GCM10009087_02090 [Sphingomonas oligophenolica]|uniref:PilZ domain-containing protein n=1 Tax=Sphingomonas oligophenolica TaxID=301154 RepID=A0ABU9Y0V2_9SPHN